MPSWSHRLLLLAGLLAPAAAAQEAPPVCESGLTLSPGACLTGEALADGFASLRGGVRRDVAALAQVKLGLQLDLGTLAGLDGWSVGMSAFGILGRQPTPTLIGGLAPLSNAEALPTFRLSELWVQREVERIGSLRLGQLAADAEFLTAAAAGSLTNGTFGWPLATSTALPSGGPSYPFAAPGVRLALGDLDNGSGFRVALLSGDPGGRYGEGTDPQRHNRHGTNFSFTGGSFLIGELVLGTAAPARGQPRPWVVKLGAWRHSGGFDDQRGDLSRFTDPPSSGILVEEPGPTPRRRGNHAVYAVAETTLWRDGARSLAAFARVSATPPGRNLLSLYADAGLALRGPFGRAADTASLGLAYARTGGDGRAQDRALGRPLRDREVVVEANYELGLIPDRLFVRPLVQWISHPNAGRPDDRVPGGRLRDAVVVGLRVRSAL